jgi:hypothetical protein
VAVLVGHGPVEPDVLQQLLLASPVLRAVHVDAAGVPVSVSDRVHRPQRRDPQAVRQALLAVAAEPPGHLHPRHPNDHRQAPTVGPPRSKAQPSPRSTIPDGRAAGAPVGMPARTPAAVGTSHPPAAAGTGHPPDRPGSSRPPRRLRRLIDARAPRCEFPGCGARAVACDAEHDDAWPSGPTCACNLGPCCRRHHRCKQEGWTKQRLQDSAVRWTSPTGRAWTSPPQHHAPTPPLRPLRAVSTASPWDELDPISLEQLLWELDGRPDDPAALELRAVDVDPDDLDSPDRLGGLLSSRAGRWTVDLDDPYSWMAETTPARS